MNKTSRLLATFGAVVSSAILAASCAMIRLEPVPEPEHTEEPIGVSRVSGSIEEQIFDEINLARTDPAGYATFIQDTDRDAHEAIAYLRSTDPVNELAWDDGLAQSAADHVKDNGRAGTLSHTGTDGSSPHERITRYLRAEDVSASGENIQYGPLSARGVVIELIVDRNVPGRGHRDNIFSPMWTHVGIAVGPHATYSVMCVMDFARVGPPPPPEFDSDPALALRQIVREINFARTRPKEYAETIRDMDFDPADVLTTIDFLMSVAPRPALVQNSDLSMLAASYANEVAETDRIRSATTLPTRSRWFLKTPPGELRELVNFGVAGPREAVADFIVNPRDPEKRYRESIFSVDYTHVGAAYGPHQEYGVMCVLELARF